MFAYWKVRNLLLYRYCAIWRDPPPTIQGRCQYVESFILEGYYEQEKNIDRPLNRSQDL